MSFVWAHVCASKQRASLNTSFSNTERHRCCFFLFKSNILTQVHHTCLDVCCSPTQSSSEQVLLILTLKGYSSVSLTHGLKHRQSQQMFDASSYVLYSILYSICTVAEVWRCSEHYLWLFDSSFLVEVYAQHIVIVQSFLRLLKLRKLAVGKLDLSMGGLTLCHGVLDHGLNLHRNIPLMTE